MDWKPVINFYVKATSWILIPLLLAFFGGRYVSDKIGSQILFFVLVILGFAVTCYGLYREINEYKKTIEADDNNKKDIQQINGN